MKNLFRTPRLPDRMAELVLVSGEYPVLIERLHELGVETVQTLPDLRLPKPTAFHPDMQACILDGETIFVLRNSSLRKELRRWGIAVRETESQPGERYPQDVVCNAFVLNGRLIALLKGVDPAVLGYSQRIGLAVLPVKQGYASCSTMIVDTRSIVTSDPGIAQEMKSKGFQVLEIRPGYIELPGYDHGFLGGSCGLLGPDLMAVSGKLDLHPDGARIREFLQARGIFILELTDERLFDIGGILPLR